MAAADYDAALAMFRERPKVIDLPRIRFLRWLVEHGRLEHYPVGPPCGPVLGLLRESERVRQLGS